MTPNKQVSSVIRISQGKRDASARATHLEAATGKFLVTTNERKQMSTKTNFKRIALVAVAALGLGVLSSVPSQAAVVGLPSVTATNGTATIQTSDSTTAATLTVKFNATAGADSLSISATLGSKPAGAAGATDSVMTTVADTATSTGATTVITGRSMADTATAVGTQSTTPLSVGGVQQVLISTAAGVAAAKFRYQLDTALVRIAGTYTVDYVVKVYSAGVEVTASAAFGQMLITVTDGSAAASGAVTASGTSSAVIYQGSDFVAGNTLDSTSIAVANTPDATADAVIRITQKTAAGLPSRESITVTTNIGNLGQNTAGATGKSLVLVGSASGVDDIKIYADGTAGTATITIKTTSVTFSSKTVVFFGTTVTSITGTALLTTLGTTSSGVIVAVPKDANGVTVRSNNAVYMYSSDVAVINTGATGGTSCGNYDADYEGYLCQIGGTNNGTASITLRNGATVAASTVASTAISLTVNTAAAAKFTLAFNKATYAPGEKAYIIVKPLDAAGKAIGGGTQTNLFAAGGITSSLAFGNGSETTTAATVATAGTLATAGVASVEAVKLYTVYMPSSGGAVTITATGGSLLPASGQVAVTASATVTDSGAAALAAVNALATTVASLRTLITTLTNLVLKIQKKVKA